MKIACSLLAIASAVAVSCGGAPAKATVAPPEMASEQIDPCEQARRLSADYASLVSDYNALCDMRREALAEQDDERRGERVAAIDSMVYVLAGRGRELDALWWSCAAEYRDRDDGSFTEFCRAAEIDSAHVDVEMYRIYRLSNI